MERVDSSGSFIPKAGHFYDSGSLLCKSHIFNCLSHWTWWETRGESIQTVRLCIPIPSTLVVPQKTLNKYLTVRLKQ